VVVRGSRIAEILPAADLKTPDGAMLIDGHGAYLMPGLADMHTHLNDALFTHPFFNLFLANGVTTIRDLAQGSPPSVLQYRREIDSGRRLGPHIYVANIYWGWEPDALGQFTAQQPLGYDCAKLNSYFSPDAFAAVMQQAKRMKIYTLGHIPYALGLDGVLAAGMNEVSHVDELILSEMIGLDHGQDLTPDQWEQQMVASAVQAFLPLRDRSPAEIRQAVIGSVQTIMEKLRGKDIAFTTTLICDEDTVDKLLHREKLAASAHAPYSAPQFWQDLDKGTDKHQQMLPGMEWGFAVFYELDKIVLQEMRRNGVRLVLGTDVGPTYLSLVPGFSVHDELRILVENGFTPYEALATCTRNASEIGARMTGRDEFGTVEVGKRADLVLVAGNPLADLSSARKPLGVMAAGHWLPSDTLAAMLQVKTKKAKDRLAEAYGSGGTEAVLAEYRAMRDSNLHNDYYYSTANLNVVAYDLLGAGKVDDAVRLFELNVADYPEDPNNYDSLAEAYMKRGDNQLAIQFYRKSLALDPSNANAVAMLKSLGAE
jgi:imidazolonepropionase-like amidohydrolase